MRIGISLPDALLARIDRRARKAGLNRSRLIARGLEAVFRAEDRKQLTGSFDSVFSDKTLRAEQNREAALFDSLPFGEEARVREIREGLGVLFDLHNASPQSPDRPGAG